MNRLYIFIFVCNFSSRIAASTPDSATIVDRPDFYKTNKNSDTSFYCSFITPGGLLRLENSNYDSSVICKVIIKVNGQEIGRREYINRGNGLWFAIFYDKEGGIFSQGSVRESGKIKDTADSLTYTSIDPPYNTKEVIFRIHETVREGWWIFYDSKQSGLKRKVFYRDGKGSR